MLNEKEETMTGDYLDRPNGDEMPANHETPALPLLKSATHDQCLRAIARKEFIHTHLGALETLTMREDELRVALKERREFQIQTWRLSEELHDEQARAESLSAELTTLKGATS